MPFIDVKIIEGVLSHAQQQALIAELAEAVVVFMGVSGQCGGSASCRAVMPSGGNQACV